VGWIEERLAEIRAEDPGSITPVPPHIAAEVVRDALTPIPEDEEEAA
jgi:hypothetical protein